MAEADALPLRCRCGALEGRLLEPRRAGRAVCYCRDCRAFARWLGRPQETLDAAGGTDILATLPSRVRLERGREHLACLSLSPRGLLRWHAGCCRTPIGNAPRDPRLSYFGLVHDVIALPPAALDAAVGPPRCRVNTASALAPVASTPLAALGAVATIVRQVGGARLRGGWRDNPFFVAGSATPVVVPQVLTPAERAALADAAG